jgi:ribosomal subunit interface protein
MQTPLELTFRNMEPSDFVARQVHAKVKKLERFYGRITSCHVFIDAPHRHQRKGKHYAVRIEVRVPGSELVVNDKPGDVNAHEDLKVAVRDAFDAMERQLKRWKARASGEVKAHEGPLQGRIVEIDHDKGFGHIAASDGRLVYFHRNSVVEGRFSALAAGDPVELVAQSEESPIGPQASTVRPIGPLRYAGTGGKG